MNRPPAPTLPPTAPPADDKTNCSPPRSPGSARPFAICAPYFPADKPHCPIPDNSTPPTRPISLPSSCRYAHSKINRVFQTNRIQNFAPNFPSLVCPTISTRIFDNPNRVRFAKTHVYFHLSLAKDTCVL